MKSVYVVECEWLYKIWITENIKSRTSQIQTGNSKKINIIFVSEKKYTKKEEEWLHEKFKEKRVHWEWFNLGADDVYFINNDSLSQIAESLKINCTEKNNIWFRNSWKYKCFQHKIDVQKYLLNEIGITYLWYLNLLLNTLTYDNTVDFRALNRLGIKQWMIDVCKKKLISKWVIKKYKGDFYMSPDIAIKWEKINPDIKKLFE